MKNNWRLIVLPDLPPLETQTVYHALANIQSKHNSPNTLILTWPNTPYVSIGIHQVIDLVVDTNAISEMDIPLIRRITGGGAVYLDQNQLFYQLIFNKNDYPFSVKELFEHFLQPVVSTYRYLGIPAKYQPLNDIVALDKKISGNGASAIDRSTILVGNFILDFPVKEMSRILKVPDEKFRDKIAKTLEERIGSIKYFLGYSPDKLDLIYNFKKEFEDILGISLEVGSLTELEKNEIQRLNQYYQTEEWINYVERRHKDLISLKIKSGVRCFFNEVKTKGGLISLYIQVEENTIADIAITGDFFIKNPFNLSKLEENLMGTELSQELLKQKIDSFYQFSENKIEGLESEELAEIIIKTVNK
ncbi:MAG: lipoate--protein ligase family protein [Candidatus Heimdallarchaeum aukensis]|uniref:lipoate--protein ligase n=1 Tax=Candidatus Heimdallarchaeum aukensis TaxID=2876573 RepID=A0A9Y1BNE2_9ARCH|nr:MAG: lipoate--protein ligase family protein [Candidatus Heimdallarchaeum aukensis]